MGKRATIKAKPCAVCGREIQWRKKWERDWEQIKYCSKACRQKSKPRQQAQLDQELLACLKARAPKTICPSETARAWFGDQWRQDMETVRQAARRLVAQGQAEILQQGRVVDPSTAKGPIRVRLKP